MSGKFNYELFVRRSDFLTKKHYVKLTVDPGNNISILTSVLQTARQLSNTSPNNKSI